jgi:hypothetical protein
MADDIESALSKLEDAAPLTAEPGDDDYIAHPIEDEGEGTAPVIEDDGGDKTVKTAEGDKGVDDAAAKAAAQKQQDKLPLEEIEKRWNDQKAATAKEREQRRAEAARREQAEARAAQAEQNFARLQAALRAGQNPAPNPEEDIIGALKHTQAQVAAYQQAEQQRQQQLAAQNQQTQYVNTLRHKIEDFEGEFKAEHPDYDEATDYILDLEQQRLEAIGVPRDKAVEAVENWAINTANIMLRAGRNPAQVAYEQAQKMGWKPKGAVVDPVVAAATAQAAAAAQSTEKLAQVRAGQKAAQTLSGGGAGGKQFGGTIKEIVNLKGAAFDDAFEKFMRND